MNPPTEPFRIIVCGGRTFGIAQIRESRAVHRAECERRWLVSALDRLHARLPVGLLACGGAPGADRFAEIWAAERDVNARVFPAMWAQLGNEAGPTRNREMLHTVRPHLVVAFPGGSGTAHMVHISREAGVQVWEPRRPRWMP